MKACQLSKTCSTEDMDKDFRDGHTDASSFLSVIRLLQRRPDQASGLLGPALQAHHLTGHLEQLDADYLILSLCQELSGRPSATAWVREKGIRTI